MAKKNKKKAGEAERKYRTELGLIFYSDALALIHPEELRSGRLTKEHEKLLNTCHIYLICRRPALAFDPLSMKATNGQLSGNLIYKVEGKQKRVAFSSPADVQAGTTFDISSYPHRMLTQVERDGSESELPLCVVAQSFNLKSRDVLDLEVLYVGQSFAKGARSALARLKSHETLQKILAEQSANRPDDEVMLILANYRGPKRFATVGGSTPATIKGKADEEHAVKALTAPIAEQHRVNLSEAGLIRYFDPSYNSMFRSLFPKSSQKLLDRCYELDFSTLVIELNTEAIGLRTWSPKVEAGFHHIASFDLHGPTRRSFFNLDAGSTIDASHFTGPIY